MATICKGNPYTHQEEKRESVSGKLVNEDGCFWCGRQRNPLYRYNNTKGLFCNKGCWRAYHS